MSEIKQNKVITRPFENWNLPWFIKLLSRQKETKINFGIIKISFPELKKKINALHYPNIITT